MQKKLRVMFAAVLMFVVMSNISEHCHNLVVKRNVFFYVYEFENKISGRGLIGQSAIDVYPN